MNILVLGGGITGRLIQHVIPDARVYDWAPEPPRKLTRSWGANYLWSPLEGLPCRAFPVVTHIDGREADADAVRAYKRKVGKENEVASPCGVERALREQFPVRMTGYELVDAVPATITYAKCATLIDTTDRRVWWRDGGCTAYDYLLSTIPLNALLSLLEHNPVPVDAKNFVFKPIYVRVLPMPPDALFHDGTMYVNYLTHSDAYRYCDRGGERHYEGLTNMGAVASKKIVPGKIFDWPESAHRHVHTLLARCGIYCFGRFGAWRSNELVHQTYHRIQAFRSEVLDDRR